jgi:hypothetical protein
MPIVLVHRQALAQNRESDRVPPQIFTFIVPNAGSKSLSLATVPEIDIGDSSHCQFNRIRALLTQRDGSLVVANSGNSELCFFDRGGRFVKRAGRTGSGPGEYRDMTFVTSVPSDSLIVYDAFLRRFSLLAPNGTYVRTIPVTAPPDVSGSVTLVLGLSDGTVLVGFSEFTIGAPSPHAIEFSQLVFRFNTAGRLVGL